MAYSLPIRKAAPEKIGPGSTNRIFYRIREDSSNQHSEQKSYIQA